MTNMTSMKAGSSLYALAAATALMVAPMAASAATVTILDWDASASNRAGVDYAVGYGAITPGNATWTTPPGVEVGQTAISSSPFVNTAVQDVNNYFVIPDDGATLPFTTSLVFQTVRDSFTFLWGSIDNYNSVQFRLGGVGGAIQQIISGEDWYNGTDLMEAMVGNTNSAGNTLPAVPFAAGAGNYRHIALVNFSGFEFDTVTFKAENVAFEYAMIPLPAAGWLLLGGLGALGAVARRKRRKAA